MPDDLVSRLLESEEGKAAGRAAGVDLPAIRALPRLVFKTALLAFLRSLASTERGRGWLAALALPGEQLKAATTGLPTDAWHEVEATLSAAMEVRGPGVKITDTDTRGGWEPRRRAARQRITVPTSPDPSPPTQPVWTIRKCPQCEHETLDAIAACPMGCAPLEAVEVVPRSQADELAEARDRLADWIEERNPGTQVYRENGLVVT